MSKSTPESVMSPVHNKDLKVLKANAKQRFGLTPGVLGIGIGENSLRVYIHESSIQNQLPKSFQGVKLDFIVTGDIAPA